VTTSKSDSKTWTPVVAIAVLDYSLSAESLRGRGSADLRTMRIRLQHDRWDEKVLAGRLAGQTLSMMVLLSNMSTNITNGVTTTTSSNTTAPVANRGFINFKDFMLHNSSIQLLENNTVMQIALNSNSSYSIAWDERIRIQLPSYYAESKRAIRPDFIDVVVVADIAPSSLPVPIPRGVTASAQAVSVTATIVSGSLVGTSTSASLVARSNLILQMSQCNFDLEAPPDFMSSPTRVQIGTVASYYTGGSLMNPFVLLGTGLFHFSIVLLVWRCKRLPTLQCAMSKASFPYYQYFVVMLLMQPTVMCSVTALFETPDAGPKVIASFSLLAVLAVAGQIVWVVSKKFRCVLVPWSKTNRVKNFFVGPSKWVDITAESTNGHGGKSGEDADGDFTRMYGTLFEDYTLNRQWFVYLEVLLNIISGIIEGVHPSPGYCRTFAFATAISFTVYLLLFLVLRPMAAPVMTIFIFSITALQTLGVWLVAIDPLNPDATAAATSVSLLSMYLIGVKTIFDLLMMVLDRVFHCVKIYDTQTLSKTFNQEGALSEMEAELAIAEMSAREEAQLLEERAHDVFANLSDDGDFIDIGLAVNSSGPRRREVAGIDGNYNPLNDNDADPFSDLNDILDSIGDRRGGDAPAANLLLVTQADRQSHLLGAKPTSKENNPLMKARNPIKAQLDTEHAGGEQSQDSIAATLALLDTPPPEKKSSKESSTGKLTPGSLSPKPPQSGAPGEVLNIVDELEALLELESPKKGSTKPGSVHLQTPAVAQSTTSKTHQDQSVLDALWSPKNPFNPMKLTGIDAEAPAPSAPLPPASASTTKIQVLDEELSRLLDMDLLDSKDERKKKKRSSFSDDAVRSSGATGQDEATFKPNLASLLGDVSSQPSRRGSHDSPKFPASLASSGSKTDVVGNATSANAAANPAPSTNVASNVVDELEALLSIEETKKGKGKSKKEPTGLLPEESSPHTSVTIAVTPPRGTDPAKKNPMGALLGQSEKKRPSFTLDDL
jgi:hypothetical protein